MPFQFVLNLLPINFTDIPTEVWGCEGAWETHLPGAFGLTPFPVGTPGKTPMAG